MPPPTKRLLLFAAKLGYQTRSFEATAQKLGIELTYVTDRCHQLEDPWGDQAIAVRFDSPESAAYTVMEAMRGKEVGGVLALGDRPGVAAAYSARGLGISYNHPLAVEACRSKVRIWEVFRDAGLRVPWFRTIPIYPLPEPSLQMISYPCVLKPVSLSASQGVVRANNREEFLKASARIARLLQSPEILAAREPNLDQIIVEGFIPGREVAVEGLLVDGTLKILAIFDKPDPLDGPYFEETIYVTPSRLPQPVQYAVEVCAKDAIHALGLSHGPVHAEFRINDEGVWPLEVAARPIGGLCARSLRFGASDEELVSLEELLIRHALDLPGQDLLREADASGVMMIPVPQSGVLQGVSGEENAQSVPGITGLMITARLHDTILAWPEGASYLGFLFARGDSPDFVERALREAHQRLTFKIASKLPVEHPATHRMNN